MSQLDLLTDEHEAWKLQRKRAATEWAKAVLTDPNAVVIDTETTGLHKDAEVVEISAMTTMGEVLLDTMVRPKFPMTYGARKVHRITDGELACAPLFSDIVDQLVDVYDRSSCVLMYHAAFDRRMIEQSSRIRGRQDPELLCESVEFVCAMKAYAVWRNDWDAAKKSFRWHKLEGGNHRALGDCIATVNFLKQMADDVEQIELSGVSA